MADTTAHDAITVRENGKDLRFTFDSLNAFHGGGFPGGVAHGLKVMQAAFPLLSDTPPERRELSVLTAFAGPGGRDAIEMVTRALTDGRFVVDRALGGKDVLSEPPGPYVFLFSYRGKTAKATINPGHVREEFVALSAKQNKTPQEENRLEELKTEMATRLLPLPATEIYTVRLVD